MLLFFVFTKNIYSQTSLKERAFIQAQMRFPTSSYIEIEQRADLYFKSLNEENETEDDEELRKVYFRWREYWSKRNYYPGCPIGGDVKGALDYSQNSLLAFGRCTTSYIGNSTWQSEGPQSNSNGLCNQGYVQAIGVDPNNNNNIYAASNTGGLFRSQGGGNIWSDVTTNVNLTQLGVSDIKFNPFNSSNILITTKTNAFGGSQGVGILESNNGGNSWTLSNMTNGPASSYFSGRIKFSPTTNPNDPVYAAVGNQIWTKAGTGNAASWTAMNVSNTIPMTQNIDISCNTSPTIITINRVFEDLEVLFVNNSIHAYASTSSYPEHGNSYLLKMVGNTWTSMNLPTSFPNSASFISLDVTPTDPGALYVFYVNLPNHCNTSTANYIIAKTYDDGNTWIIVAQNNYDGVNNNIQPLGNLFEMSDIIPNTVYMAGVNVVKGTIANGICNYVVVTNSFPTLQVNTHMDIRCIELKSNIVASTETLYVGCDGGVIKSTDFGVNWTCINGDGLNIAQFYSLSTFNKTDNIVASPQDNWVKRKVGLTWTVANGPMVVVGYDPNNNPIYGPSGGSESCWSESSMIDDDLIYISEWDEISKSNDGGITFYLTGYPSSNVLGRRFYLDPTDKNILWSGFESDANLHKYTSTGTGLNSGFWQTIHQNTGSNPVSAIAVAPTNSNVIIEAHATPDWNAANNNLPASKKLFICTNLGSTNPTWTDISANLGIALKYLEISHIVFDPLNEKRIFVSFYGYGPQPNSNNPGAGSYRVLLTENQGLTWTDISNGLPAFAVNFIAYQNGTNDVLYAATDAGVYRYHRINPTQGIWECFNSGLPPVACRKIDINYCRKKLFVATYGRGAYSCDLPQTPVYHITNLLVNTINGNSIASPTLVLPSYYKTAFANDIEVDPNVYFEQRGLMSFNPSNGFTVGKNSHVVLTGTMTTNCTQVWKGILVNGNANSNQAYSNGFSATQGILEVLNDGCIKNANVAISNYTYTSNGADNNSTGGIISCFKAHFVNNKKDVSFLPYSYSNKSKFILSNFVTNNQLLGGINIEGHVSMSGVNGITFQGCEFNYSAGSVYAASLHGYGILSYDSKYTVNNICTSNSLPCLSNIRSKFLNLNNGIVAHNTINPFQTINVSYSDFQNNLGDGIYLQNLKYPQIINNNITVGVSSWPTNGSSGIYLNNCQHYSIQNNTIAANYNNGHTYGIIAQNSGGGDHLIYRNKIDACSYGISVQGNNAGNGDGLRIRCNDFGLSNQNSLDIANQQYLNFIPQIFTMQGTYGNNPNNLSFLVGNRYAASCLNTLGSKWHVDQGGGSFYHPNNNNLTCLINPQPSCSSPQVLWATLPFNYNPLLQCFDNFTTPKTIGEINSIIQGKIANVSNTQNHIDSIIDNGNTSNLLNFIAGNSSESILTQTLILLSPFISDTVLSTYLTKTIVPVNSIQNILELNSPLSTVVWQKIINRNFSDSIQLELTRIQNSKLISQRTLFESNVLVENLNLQSAYIEKLNMLLLDTLDASIDSLRSILGQANFSDSKCQIISSQIAQESHTITPEIINTIHGGSSKVDNFCNLLKIILPYYSANIGLNAIESNSSLRTQIEEIANDENNSTNCVAKSIMTSVFGTNYTHPYLTVNTGAGNRPFDTFEEELNTKNEDLVISENEKMLIYPNPTNQSINIHISSLENKNYQVAVVNSFGQSILIKTIESNKTNKVDLDEFNKGLYIIVILRDGMVLRQSKLVLTD